MHLNKPRDTYIDIGPDHRSMAILLLFYIHLMNRPTGRPRLLGNYQVLLLLSSVMVRCLILWQLQACHPVQRLISVMV